MTEEFEPQKLPDIINELVADLDTDAQYFIKQLKSNTEIFIEILEEEAELFVEKAKHELRKGSSQLKAIIKSVIKAYRTLGHGIKSEDLQKTISYFSEEIKGIIQENRDIKGITRESQIKLSEYDTQYLEYLKRLTKANTEIEAFIQKIKYDYDEELELLKQKFLSQLELPNIVAAIEEKDELSLPAHEKKLIQETRKSYNKKIAKLNSAAKNDNIFTEEQKTKLVKIKKQLQQEVNYFESEIKASNTKILNFHKEELIKYQKQLVSTFAQKMSKPYLEKSGSSLATEDISEETVVKLSQNYEKSIKKKLDKILINLDKDLKQKLNKKLKEIDKESKKFFPQKRKDLVTSSIEKMEEYREAELLGISAELNFTFQSLLKGFTKELKTELYKNLELEREAKFNKFVVEAETSLEKILLNDHRLDLVSTGKTVLHKNLKANKKYPKYANKVEDKLQKLNKTHTKVLEKTHNEILKVLIEAQNESYKRQYKKEFRKKAKQLDKKLNKTLKRATESQLANEANIKYKLTQLMQDFDHIEEDLTEKLNNYKWRSKTQELEVPLPHSYTDLCRILKITHNIGSARLIQKLTTKSGNYRWIVYIPGVQHFKLNAYHPNVHNIPNSVREFLDKSETGHRETIKQAIKAAGIGIGDEVLLVGHSLGGMSAINLLSDDDFMQRYKAVGLITFGSPNKHKKLPETTRVPILRVENSKDPIPKFSNLKNEQTRKIQDRVITLYPPRLPKGSLHPQTSFIEPHDLKTYIKNVKKLDEDKETTHIDQRKLNAILKDFMDSAIYHTTFSYKHERSTAAILNEIKIRNEVNDFISVLTPQYKNEFYLKSARAPYKLVKQRYQAMSKASQKYIQEHLNVFPDWLIEMLLKIDKSIKDS
ncbi:MAG: hypothetical protein QM613_05915 [Micrococcaceae bacterium]